MLFFLLPALELDTLDTPNADFTALTLGTATGVPKVIPDADTELDGEEGRPELGANPGVSGERWA